MTTRATRGPWGSASWVFILVALLLSACSPDAFLVSDEDRDRNYQRAQAAEQLRDYAGAAEYYERALERNPRAANVHLSYAALCEGPLARYAEAVHHYNRYLRLNPSDPKAEDIRRRVTYCTERLATSVPVVIRSETIARDLDAMRRENLDLRAQVTNLVAGSLVLSNEVRRLTQELTIANAALQGVNAAQGRRDPSGADRSGAATPRASGAGPSGSRASGGTPAPVRSYPTTGTVYRVRAGDTLASIARRHGVPVSALRAANPTLNERRLVPGAAVQIPRR